ncbi:hypothetical protein MMC18_006498 [Xylographa bjoerkii]|nr:hypothetical protein [Xylographa bjoerkii]
MAITRETQYVLHADIPYVSNPHIRQHLDLYLPSNPHAQTKSPLIVYVHGGAFRYGSKTDPQYAYVPLRLLSPPHSYAIASLDYRMSGDAPFPAMIEDCKSAVRFLRSSAIAAKYGLDPDQVVVYGESAGGHATSFLGTTSFPTGKGKYDVGDHLDVSSTVQGVVSYYGPTNFLKMDPFLPPSNPEEPVVFMDLKFSGHNDAGSPESLYMGAQITKIPERVAEADPCEHVEAMVKAYADAGQKKPEFFLAHGTKDGIVPMNQSEILMEELQRNGIEVEFMPVDGADHEFGGITDEQRRELDERTEAFLRRVFGK